MNTTKTPISTKVRHSLELEGQLVIKNGVIEQTPILLNFLQVTKELEEQIEASYAYLKEQMVANNVRSVKGEWGSLTIAERLNWKTIDTVAPRFYKKTLDTSKLKAYYIAMNRLPNGVDVSTTQYLSKRLTV